MEGNPVEIEFRGCQCKIVIAAAPKLALTINQLCCQLPHSNFNGKLNIFANQI